MQDPNEDTEWNDALRKHGIIPEKEPTEAEIAEEALVEALTEAAAAANLRKAGVATEETSLDELERMLEDVADDDEETAREAYRAKRIAELKAAAALERFGEVINITGNEYVKEVNEAGKGVWVALLLYKTDLVVCRKLQQIWAELAGKHKATKFVQSVGRSCIPNYPDKNLPTIFIYQDDDLKTQFVGPQIFGGMAMTKDDVEWALSKTGALKTELKEDPRLARARGPNKAPFGIQVTDRAAQVLAGDSGSDTD